VSAYEAKMSAKGGVREIKFMECTVKVGVSG